MSDNLDNRVVFHKNRISGSSSMEVPGGIYGKNESFSMEAFSKKLQISVKHLSPLEMEFDLVGVDASIANAFRRIMIAEVPTMAIKTAYIINNTSTIPDEMLAHRLGLLPIKADPALFAMPDDQNDEENINNSLVFRLYATCQYNKDAPKSCKNPKEKYIGAHVTSGSFYWMPEMGQLELLKNRQVSPIDSMFANYWKQEAIQYSAIADQVKQNVPVSSEKLEQYWDSFPPEVRWAIRPLDADIVVDKLRPGQIVDIQVRVAKGLGKDHAKYSPVCPASYRLLPDIIIKEPIRGEDALKFQKCFLDGVIGLKTVKLPDGSTTQEAYVANPRLDTMSRECLRHDEFKDKVGLTRIRDHFIFSIESVGQYDSPASIFAESCKVLMNKCQNLLEAVEALEQKHKPSISR